LPSFLITLQADRRGAMSNPKETCRGVWKCSFLILIFTLCFAMLTFSACRTSKPSLQPNGMISENIKYSKYNIHTYTHRPTKAHYAGFFESGEFIPAGSKLYYPGKGHPWRKGFWFNVVNTGQEVFFEFYSSRMRMTELEYYHLITSDTPVHLESFSEIDRKGIMEGKVYTGMSKEGVLTALGYPPRHKTPFLENNTWVYYRNRAVTISIEFDENGIVIGEK